MRAEAFRPEGQKCEAAERKVDGHRHDEQHEDGGVRERSKDDPLDERPHGCHQCEGQRHLREHGQLHARRGNHDGDGDQRQEPVERKRFRDPRELPPRQERADLDQRRAGGERCDHPDGAGQSADLHHGQGKGGDGGEIAKGHENDAGDGKDQDRAESNERVDRASRDAIDAQQQRDFEIHQIQFRPLPPCADAPDKSMPRCHMPTLTGDIL